MDNMSNAKIIISKKYYIWQEGTSLYFGSPYCNLENVTQKLIEVVIGLCDLTLEELEGIDRTAYGSGTRAIVEYIKYMKERELARHNELERVDIMQFIGKQNFIEVYNPQVVEQINTIIKRSINNRSIKDMAYSFYMLGVINGKRADRKRRKRNN